MKTTMKFLTMITLALFIGITTTSCSSEDGDTGPQGVAGVDGTDGQDGNANVIASSWFDITWSNSNGTVGFFDQATTEITQDVLDSAAILIYVKNTGGVVYSTPTAWTPTATIGSRAEIGTIRVYYYSETSINMSSVDKVRYVIIPSSTSGRSGINFENMSYEEVMDYYGLDY